MTAVRQDCPAGCAVRTRHPWRHLALAHVLRLRRPERDQRRAAPACPRCGCTVLREVPASWPPVTGLRCLGCGAGFGLFLGRGRA